MPDLSPEAFHVLYPYCGPLLLTFSRLLLSHLGTWGCGTGSPDRVPSERLHAGQCRKGATPCRAENFRPGPAAAGSPTSSRDREPLQHVSDDSLQLLGSFSDAPKGKLKLLT